MMATKKMGSTDGSGAGGAQPGSAGGSAESTPPSVKQGAGQKGAARGGTGKTAGAKATGAKSAGAKTTRSGTAGSTSTAGRSRQPRGGSDLRSDVRGFASGRPDGWNHDEWLGFLSDLQQRGHSVEDREAIGSMLERERLGVVLEKVPGIGAQRIRSITERYGNVWRLKETTPDELARETSIPRPLAERIIQSIQ